ncbi:hypothetical protein C8R45DRAFT_566737 [Mycena sanguinolenta]|nr:hypothetical protein C8R45DRAFT_566737 [Mycena sanguinolenta]
MRHATCTVSTTSAPHDAAGRQVGRPSGKSESRLAHVAQHSSRRMGKPPARMMRARCAAGGAPGGRSENRKPFALVSKLRTCTWAHDTRAGVQDVDGVAIPRSVRLTRMASANPVPLASDGRMRAYRHGRSFHIRSLVTSVTLSVVNAFAESEYILNIHLVAYLQCPRLRLLNTASSFSKRVRSERPPFRVSLVLGSNYS